jgi:quinol-cytochrome oxidoreductase complex cytochrome b subunit
MIGYLPAVGDGIKGWMLGGPEVGRATLRTFFAFHIVVLPLLITIIVSYHIWRVRKDTFSLPRALDEPPLDPRTQERVTTIPHLIDIELGIGLLVLALLVAWATWIDAPLEPAANPSHPPNPAKAAWYFMGFQELLLHFHPLIVTLVIPGLAAAALIMLPYWDRNAATDPDVEGIWFRSRRGRRLAAINTVLGIVITIALVIVDEYWLDLPELLSFLPTLISNGVIPSGIIGLALIGYYWALGRRGATSSERNLALFTLLFVTFITLTAIGIFCRGENMALMFPWDV